MAVLVVRLKNKLESNAVIHIWIFFLVILITFDFPQAALENGEYLTFTGWNSNQDQMVSVL